MLLARSEPAKPVYNLSWIEWFCSLEGHDFLCCVDPEWLSDNFNLMKLEEGTSFNSRKVKQCLELILKSMQPTAEQLKDEQFLRLNQEASDVYAVIHARFLRSEDGKFSV